MKLIPFGKMIIAVILFLPISLQQAASVSADSFLNAISIFYICYTLYLYKKVDKFKTIDKILYVIISIIIAISKIAYLPMVGLSLLLVANKKIDKKEKRILISITIILSVICGMLWFLFMEKYPPTSENVRYNEAYNVNMREQLINIIQNPGTFLQVVKNLIFDGLYIDSMIGSFLGWLNINISNIVIYSFIAILVMSPFLEKNQNEMETKPKVFTILIYIATYVLIVLAAYLSWTTVGADKVMGVQGRYFIPILALPLLCVCGEKKYIETKNINMTLPIICGILNIITITDVVKFFL